MDTSPTAGAHEPVDLRVLPAVARRAMLDCVEGREPRSADVAELLGAAACTEHGGVFVTLYLAGRLRGCMGQLDASLPLSAALVDAAASAALRDPRFDPLTARELADCRITVSVMTAPRPMRSIDEIEIGRHGVIVRAAGRRGLFLPKVASELGLSAAEFLDRCCTEKAHVPAGAWRSAGAEVLIFEVREFSEVSAA